MGGYIGSRASVVSSGAERKKHFAITATTTSLTGLTYTPTMVHVYHNGIRLVDGTDFTATDGSTITLTNAAENGDDVVVVSFATFQTSDTVSKSAGGSFAGNIGIGVNSPSSSLHVKASADTVNNGIRLESADGTQYATIDMNNAGNLRFYQNGTSRMRIDDDGNVGIGVSTPAAKLDLSNGTSPTYIKQTRGSVETILGPTGSSVSNPGQVGTLTNSPFRIVTNNSEALRVTEDGYVTLPKLPAFHAKRNGNTSWQNATFSFATELFDNLNNYNGTKFTAPVAGKYYFALQLTILGGTTGQDDTMYWHFYKNGSAYQTMQDNWSYRLGTAGNGVELNCAASSIIDLAVNDYVDFRTSGLSHMGGVIHSSSHFMGYLIG